MATLLDLNAKLDALPAAIAQAVVAALPTTTTPVVDFTTVEAAISASTATIITEIKNGVEGVGTPASGSSTGAAS